jgi:NaMN:DMB phosphoribosyltransferase
MRWLNFITLNGVAPIANLHQVSDAGAGDGLMHLHPTRDTELIACGRANTLLNGKSFPSPIAGNGAVTPAILVHGIFRALQAQGYKIRLHCYQLGLSSMPDYSGCKLDQVVTHRCQLGEEAQLISEVLVPELRRQQGDNEQHLVAESGIGGTTFATLWLQRWLDSKLWFAGSTKDPKKLAIKQGVLADLTHRTAQLPRDIGAYIDNIHFSDPIQRACCALLKSELPALYFAGGAMIFAPIIAMAEEIKVARLSVATTRWALASGDAVIAAQALPADCQLRSPEIRFDDSRFDAIKMYERGFVIEGCGLGACLDFAEQQGIDSATLLACLDQAAAPWL